MKKLTLLSLVVATVLFTGCNDKAKDAVSGAASAVTESAKEATSGAVDAAKKTAGDAASAAKAKAAEVVASAKVEAENVAAAATQSVKETASSAMDSVKDAAAATTAAAGSAVASVTGNAAGKAAYAKCAGCHGADGKTKALGKSEIVAGQSVADLSTALAEYKAGTRNVSGMGMLMKGQVASMDEATITAVSEYISGL